MESHVKILPGYFQALRTFSWPLWKREENQILAEINLKRPQGFIWCSTPLSEQMRSRVLSGGLGWCSVGCQWQWLSERTCPQCSSRAGVGYCEVCCLPKSHFKPHIAQEHNQVRSSAGSVISGTRDLYPGKCRKRHFYCFNVCRTDLGDNLILSCHTKQNQWISQKVKTVAHDRRSIKM